MKRATMRSCAAAFVAAASLALSAGPAFAWPAVPQPSGFDVPPPTPPVASPARPRAGGKLVLDEEFTLRSGETLSGDLVVLSGAVTLDEGSRVDGDVIVVGGNARAFGQIGGDLTVLGGDVTLAPSARVSGDAVELGGKLTREPGAVVGGSRTPTNPIVPTPALPRIAPAAPAVPRAPGVQSPWLDGLWSALGVVSGIALLTAFAVVAVVLFPANVAVGIDAATRHWLLAAALGALSWVAMPLVLVLLALTICLIPLALLIAVGWGLTVLFGWALVARFVGEKIMIGFGRRDWTTAGQAALGAALLAALGATPLLGPIVGFLASSVGVGALILTRLGARPYLPARQL